MPSLHLFGRRSVFAGDDLQPAAILNVFMRTLQLFVLLVPIAYHASHEAHIINHFQGDEEASASFFRYIFGGDLYKECDETSHYFPLLLYLYLIATLGQLSLSVITEYVIYRISSVGAPIEDDLRSPILQKIVEKKWIWTSIVGNMIVLTFGLTPLLNYKDVYYECHDIIIGDRDENDEISKDYLEILLGKRVWWIFWIVLLTSQGIELVFSLAALGRFLQKEKAIQFIGQNNNYGTNWTEEDYSIHGPRYHQHHHELAEEMWDTRCRNFCKCAASSTCYLFGGRDLVDGVAGDYGQVSRALADYFEDGGVLDLVPSDIAAGFIMLQRIQRQRVLDVRRNIAEDMKKEYDFNRSESSRSSVSHNMHSFGDSRSDRMISSAIDHFEEGTIGTAGVSNILMPSKLPHDNDTDHLNEMLAGGSLSIHPPPIVDDMLTSVLQPLPYSRMLLFPHADSNTAQLASSPHRTSALMLRRAPDEERDSEHWYEAQERKVLDKDDEADRHLIAEGARYARHSLSIYTWLLYFYMQPVGSMPYLLYCRLSECCRPKRRPRFFNDLDTSGDNRSSCCSEDHGDTIGDNCLHLHRNALMAHSGLEDTDLIYANFINKYNQMPYCIVVDHKWHSVVISIRGTLSLEDCLVDVLVDPEGLEGLGQQYGFDGQGQYCHSGVLACVQALMKDLERHRILESLLSDVGAEYPHYKLRLTGHSLGAGCATLLGYILRRRFPDLKVIAISPPGGCFTWKFATECKDFVTTFVLDSDLVPRLSVATMEHLRDEILDVLGRIKVNKMQVAKSFVSQSLRRGDLKDSDDPDSLAKENLELLHPKDFVPTNSTFHRQLENFQAIQRDRRDTRREIRDIEL